MTKIQVNQPQNGQFGLGPSRVWVKLQHYHVQLCAKDYLIYNSTNFDTYRKQDYTGAWFTLSISYVSGLGDRLKTKKN